MCLCKDSGWKKAKKMHRNTFTVELQTVVKQSDEKSTLAISADTPDLQFSDTFFISQICKSGNHVKTFFKLV